MHPGMVLEHRLEPRVVVDQGLRRLRDLVVEVLRVHLEGQRLELGGDLLETQARSAGRSRRTGSAGGSSSAVTRSFGDHVLAQQERALPAASPRCRGRWRARRTRASRGGAPRRSRRVAIVEAVSPCCTTNSTWAGSLAAGSVSAVPMSSRTMSCDERQLERRGVVGRPAEDRAVDERPEGRERDDQHDPGEDQREEQEPDEPAHAVTAAVRPAVAPAAAAAAARGSTYSGTSAVA